MKHSSCFIHVSSHLPTTAYIYVEVHYLPLTCVCALPRHIILLHINQKKFYIKKMIWMYGLGDIKSKETGYTLGTVLVLP